MVVYFLNSQINPTAKITWLIVIMLLPVFGVLLYLYTQSDFGHRALKHRCHQVMAGTKGQIPQPEGVLGRLEQENRGVAALAQYMQRSGCHPVYGDTCVTYFPLGECMFEEMLSQLEEAEHFIPASNEPSSRACADIWRMPRGSNTPPLGAERTS